MSNKAIISEPEEAIETEATSDPAQEPALQASQQLLEIRDLLFGEQLRAVHQREDEMELDLQAKLQEMNDQFSEALRELKQEFAEQLAQHQQQSAQQISALNDNLNKTRAELIASDADLQTQMQQGLEQLRQVVQKNYDDVMAKISAASEELTNNKADRKTLAAMLASMADNLTNAE